MTPAGVDPAANHIPQTDIQERDSGFGGLQGWGRAWGSSPVSVEGPFIFSLLCDVILQVWSLLFLPRLGGARESPPGVPSAALRGVHQLPPLAFPLLASAVTFMTVPILPTSAPSHSLQHTLSCLPCMNLGSHQRQNKL